MAKAGREKGIDFVYALMQYAQLLSERGDNEGAYETYKKIATLYPSITATWCQLATAYSSNGDLANAKIYADKSFAMKMPDLTNCGDALDIYSIVGDYKKALSVMESAAMDFPEYPFYLGIYKYARHDSAWKADIMAYTNEFPTVPDSDVLYKVSKYMLAPEFKDDYNDFAKLLTFSNSDFYTGLIAERAMHDYKDSILPYMVEAELMVLGHNYTKANSIYASLEKMKLDPQAENEYKLQYAYSQYCNGAYMKALTKWEELNRVTDPAYFAVTNYFMGQCYLKIGNKNTASRYFQTLVSSTDESKYSYLAKLQLEKLYKK